MGGASLNNNILICRVGYYSMSSYDRKLFIGIAGIYFSYISLGYLAEDLYLPF